MKIHCIDKNSELFPYGLKHINKSPDRIYASGDISLLKTKSIAVVGARECSEYGMKIAKLVGGTLGYNKVTHVSGMARGIDYYSHRGALEAKGKTIAVLGFGLNKCYPKENIGIKEEILREGLLISEFPGEFEGNKYSFPLRNRLISGISEGIVIVEAEYKSGSLITVNYGLEQGKNIYAVPGNLDSKKSLGTNLLIREGATPLVIIDDLIRDLGITPKLRINKDDNIGRDEMEILKIVSNHDGIKLEEISHKININSSILSGILTILIIKGYIINMAGKFFIAK